MATHSVQIIDHKQLSDGQLALLAECCSESSTHSWLTLSAEVVLDDARCQDAINFHINRVATLHESMQQALTKAQATVGNKYFWTQPTASVPATATAPPLVFSPAPDVQAQAA